MIRHIVLFRFNSGVTDETIDGFMDQLVALKEKTGLVRSIEVARDVGRTTVSYDLVLNAIFDSMENIEQYAVHPAHVSVLETINELCESTVKIDYPVQL